MLPNRARQGLGRHEVRLVCAAGSPLAQAVSARRNRALYSKAFKDVVDEVHGSGTLNWCVARLRGEVQ